MANKYFFNKIRVILFFPHFRFCINSVGHKLHGAWHQHHWRKLIDDYFGSFEYCCSNLFNKETLVLELLLYTEFYFPAIFAIIDPVAQHEAA